MPAFNPRLPAKRKISGRDMLIPGTKEKMVSKDGDINGYNKQDLMRNIATIFEAAAAGTVDLNPNAPGEGEELTAAEKRDAVVAAFHAMEAGDRSAWGEYGKVLAADVEMHVSRFGFMRNLLMRNEPQGRVAQIRTRVNNVTAVYMTTPSNLAPQFILNQWFTVPEFDIVANVMVDASEIMYEGESILQEQYDYALQAFFTAEDRMWKMMADSVVGATIPLQVFTGDFTPDDFLNMQTMMIVNGVTPSTVLMYFDYWQKFLNSPAFSNWFDPATRYEMLHSGNIGNLMGLNFITDGYREKNLQVLQPGEMYMVAQPEQHGGYTDRGPINAVPTDGFNQGLNARGWYMTERLSLAIVNPSSVVKARSAT